MAIGADDAGQLGNFSALGEGVADQAGNDEEIDWKQFQERGKNAAAARDGLVRSAESTLDNVLVRAPIPQADDGRAEEHAEPGEIVVEIISFLHDLAGRTQFLHGRPCAGNTCGNQRLPEIEHV